MVQHQWLKPKTLGPISQAIVGFFTFSINWWVFDDHEVSGRVVTVANKLLLHYIIYTSWELTAAKEKRIHFLAKSREIVTNDSVW